MSDKVFVGNSLQEMDIGQTSLPISKVILNVDSEVYYIAGDDSGKTIEADCPWATQEMANNILSKMRGFVYKPFDGTNAFIDPAAELGDGVTVGGTYSILASMGKTFDHQSVANIGAPGTDEIEDEYPYKTKQRKSTDRVLAKTRSLISKTAEEIRLEVQGVEGQLAAMDISLDEITLVVAGLDSAMSAIEQTVGSIELSVSSANGSTTFKLTADGAELSSKTLNLSVDAVNVTGKLTLDQMASISFGNLTDSATVQSKINTANSNASTALSRANSAASTAADAANTVDAWRYNGGTYIDSSKIMVTTLMATELLGGSVGLLTSAERVAGGIDITGSSSSNYAIELYSNGALRLSAGYGAVWIEDGSGASLGLSNGEISTGCTVYPNSNSNFDLGKSAYKWDNIYAVTCNATTSDRKEKNSIEDLPDKYVAMFDLMRPVRYKLNSGTSGRYHAGYIADEVKAAMDAVGIDATEFGGWIMDEDEDGNPIYMLRYDEYDAIRDAKIKQLEARVATLEGKNNEV